jgi:hypothetical protein
MQKPQERAKTRIAQALSRCRKPMCSDTADVLPVINDWSAIADHDVPHVYGVVTVASQPPRPILTAAVIVIETMPGLVIHCLDGCYRLGQPANRGYDITAVREDTHKGRVEWAKFQRLVEDLCLKLDEGNDLNF